MICNFVPWFSRLRCLKYGRLFAPIVHQNNGYKLNTNLCLNFCHAKRITTLNSRKLYGGRLQYSNCKGLSYGGVSTLHSWKFNLIGKGCIFQHNFDKNWIFLNGCCFRQFPRNFSSSRNRYQQRNRTTAIYTVALVVVVLGVSYAAVPLYRIFCQASGLGGTVQQSDAGEKIKNMTTRKERLLTVRFNADKSATMQWAFKPQQPEVKVYPGETALAFYTAKNPTGTPITGISTYNVIPFEAGQYFNKIQCFCFEEQRLNPHEQVDMPVFFYIDPEFLEDPSLYKVDTITLSYTFFQAKEAHDLGIQ